MTKDRPTMPALRFDGSVKLVEIPVPVPDPGEALIEITRAGICSTDLEITRGYMGFRGTLGHEFVGRIVSFADAAADASADAAADAAVDPASDAANPKAPALELGTRIVGEINLPCRRCPTCLQREANHCPNRRVLGILNKDGVFARYVTLPTANLHPVCETLDDQCAVFVEPLAAALRILEQVEVPQDEPALVIGDGRLGLLIAMVLARAGAAVRIVGKHPEKMGRVEPLGVAVTTREQAEELGRNFGLVVDASGSPGGWELALTKVRPRGTIVLKSTTHAATAWNPAPIVIDEITVIGSRCGPFHKALKWLQEGRIDPRPLITREFPLEEGPEALQVAGEGRSLKVLLTR